MSYRLSTEEWLNMMNGITSYGCAPIPEGSVPLDCIKMNWFDYYADEPFNHIFEQPLAIREDSIPIVLCATAVYTDGEVAIEISEITRHGFVVKAPIDCKVNYIIGYKND